MRGVLRAVSGRHTFGPGLRSVRARGESHLESPSAGRAKASGGRRAAAGGPPVARVATRMSAGVAFCGLCSLSATALGRRGAGVGGGDTARGEQL